MKDRRPTLITGGIGSGKSYVSRVLRLKGFKVYDCDLRAREIMNSSLEIRAAIAGELGEECVNPDGSLHRPRIAERVFGSDGARKWLNSLVHGHVRRDIEAWLEENAREKRLFIETAIPTTSRILEMCREVWIVVCIEEERIRRVVERDGITPEQAKARIEAQQGEYEAIPQRISRRVVNNEDEPLLPQIENLLREF